MDLKKLTINMAILGLFIFGIMSFIVITQADNEVTINKITNNPALNKSYGDLESELQSANTRSESFMDSFMNKTPTQTFGELDVDSIVAPTRTIKTIVRGMWSIFIELPQKVLGVSPIVASLISAIISILIIIGIWAIWKGAISS